MSQLFWPDRGLQVPHFGGLAGVGFAKARVARVNSRVVTIENCIVANVDGQNVQAKTETWKL